MTGNRSPARPLAAPDDKHSPAAAERRCTTPNIIDYARSETRPFGVDAPFNAVDALVLASLVYQDMPACVRTLADVEARSGTFRRRLSSIDVRHPVRSIRHLAAPEFGDATLASVSEALTPDDFHVESGHNGLADPRLTQELYAAIGVNPRFACVRVDASDEHFSEEQQMQFAAVTMLLPGGTLAVAFRGTDDSLVGWKEDFNMAFRYPVPAQHAACEYVCAVARLWRGPMVLLGHSKGGNLAVYAAMNAPCHGGVFAGRAGVPVADRRQRSVSERHAPHREDRTGLLDCRHDSGDARADAGCTLRPEGRDAASDVLLAGLGQ